MKRVAVVVVGLMLASAAVGANWSSDTKSVLGDTFSIDLDSIKNSSYQMNPIVGYWVKAKYPKNDKDLMVNGRYYRSGKFFKWVDCKNKTESNATQSIYYDINGKIIKSQSDTIQRFEEIVPESIAESHFNLVCSLSMWNEYFKIPYDSNGNKNEYQIKSLVEQYPYQAHLLKGKENGLQPLSDEEIKRISSDLNN